MKGEDLLLHLEIEKYESYLLIGMFLLVVTITRVLFKEVTLMRRIAEMIPESILLVCLGVAAGGLLRLSKQIKIVLAQVDARTFFDILLPPIILDASYQLYSGSFLFNLDGILTFAIFGTTINIFAIGLTIYFIYVKLLCNDFTFLQMLMLSSIVSAVDPVAVLAVFDQLGVQRELYILIFGESLLNDGVTVVIFDTLEKIAFLEDLSNDIYAYAVFSFFPIAFGGSCIGIIYGLFSSFICQYASKSGRGHQPMILAICAYLAFLNAQFVHWSGILALIACGLVQKRYGFLNLHKDALITLELGISELAGIAEATVFLILGLKVWDESVEWDWTLNFITLAACIFWRLVVTCLLGACINMGRLHPLTYRHFAMVWYGGLRGAVSFAMVASLHAEKVRYIHLGTTLFVILTTVLVMGSTIQPLVSCLNFFEKEEIVNFTISAMDMSVFHSVAGMETMLGGGASRLHHCLDKLQRLDITYIQPIMCKKSATEEKVKEMIEYISECKTHQRPACNECGETELQKKKATDVKDLVKQFNAVKQGTKYKQ